MELKDRADTVGQYLIIQFILQNFDNKLLEDGTIKLEKIDDNCIKMIDSKESIYIKYNKEKKKIEWEAC